MNRELVIHFAYVRASVNVCECMPLIIAITETLQLFEKSLTEYWNYLGLSLTKRLILLRDSKGRLKLLWKAFLRLRIKYGLKKYMTFFFFSFNVIKQTVS